jgi:hypothetical protein
MTRYDADLVCRGCIADAFLNDEVIEDGYARFRDTLSGYPAAKGVIELTREEIFRLTALSSCAG